MCACVRSLVRPCATVCSYVRPCMVVCATVCGKNQFCATLCGRMYERVRPCSTVYGSFRNFEQIICAMMFDHVQPCAVIFLTVCDHQRPCAGVEKQYGKIVFQKSTCTFILYTEQLCRLCIEVVSFIFSYRGRNSNSSCY